MGSATLIIILVPLKYVALNPVFSISSVPNCKRALKMSLKLMTDRGYFEKRKRRIVLLMLCRVQVELEFWSEMIY